MKRLRTHAPAPEANYVFPTNVASFTTTITAFIASTLEWSIEYKYVWPRGKLVEFIMKRCDTTNLSVNSMLNRPELRDLRLKYAEMAIKQRLKDA